MKRNIFRTLTFKLSLAMILLLLVMAVIFTVKTQLGDQMLIDENQKEQEEIIINGVNSNLQSQYDELQFALEAVINNEAILKAFAERDRETLSMLTLNIMPGLSELGVEQFQFHLPDATSFFRVHKPEQFGDDLSGFRSTVVEANQQKKIIKGFEGGVAGAGIRYVVPLSYQGTHIGTVEMGLGLNQEVLSFFKQQYNGEWYFYGIDNNDYKLLDSTNSEASDVKIDSEMLEKLKANETVVYYQKPMKYMIIPIADYSGEVKWFITRNSDQTNVENLIVEQLSSNIFFGLIIISIGLVFTFIIAKRITKPIVKIAEQVRLLSGGDLSIEQLNIKTKDEVGQLANDFNEMTLSLRQLIQHVLTTSEQVASTAEQLTASSDQTSKASEQITTAIQEVANSVERQALSATDSYSIVSEISNDIEKIDTKIESMAKLSIEANENAGSGNKVIDKAIDYMNTINEKVKLSSDHVNSLGSRSEEISQIVSLITDIADQTNLLALNAAIEAARAGENGLGFAVVADEVRKLAAQSGNAANKIKTLIELIQSETLDAVESMNEGNKAVVEGTGLVNQAGSAFRDIMIAVDNVSKQAMDVANSIQQINAGTQEMVASVKEISNISEKIAANTQDVAASTEEQNASMEEIASAANMLSEAAIELNDSIKRFKLK